MKMRMQRNATGDVRTYVIEIHDADLVRAKFDRLDEWLFRDVDEALRDGTSDTPIADTLLALETQARRIEQARVLA